MRMSPELPKSTHGAAGRVLSSGDSGEEYHAMRGFWKFRQLLQVSTIMVQSRMKILTKIRRVKVEYVVGKPNVVYSCSLGTCVMLIL